MTNRLHIGNLSSATTAASLTEAFQRDGRRVERVELVMSRDPGRSRGFAFVEMASGEDALAAVIALHGAEIDGHTVRVAIADEQKTRFIGE